MLRESLNRDWDFHLNSLWDWAGPGQAKKVDLPHDFIRDLPRDPNAPGGRSTGYFPGACGRYEKSFSACGGETVMLELDGAYMDCEVFVNGTKVLGHPYGYTGVVCDLTEHVAEGENRLRITCSSYQPGSRWYTGGGLFRPAALLRAGGTYIHPRSVFVTAPEVTADSAKVCVRYRVTSRAAEGEAAVTVRIEGADGAEAACARDRLALSDGSAEGTAELFVPFPRLWSPDAPYLYTARIACEAGGESDEHAVTFGIRRIEFGPGFGMRLNGEGIKLRGGCVHHDSGFLGAEAFPESEERKVRILKEAGFNAIRTAHNPPSGALLDACDRLGMLVLEESFDCWTLGKNPLDYHRYFDNWWEYDTAAMVERDRNHPSVFAWSIGNEILEFDGTSGGAERGRMQAKLVRRLDPTRPVTSGINCACGRPSDAYAGMTPQQRDEYIINEENGIFGGIDAWDDATRESIGNLDICGYNYLFRRYAVDREKHPERVIVGTESRSIQTYENWHAVLDNPNVIGDFVWVAYDNLGEVGGGRAVWSREYPANARFFGSEYPWISCFQGDMDLTGKRRPVSFYRAVVWGVDRGVHLFTRHPDKTGLRLFGTGWHWDDVLPNWTFGAEWIGKSVVCTAYADADEVAFTVNGREAARCAVRECIAKAEIPYEPGRIEAVAYRSGKEACRDAIETRGEPCAIVLEPEKACVSSDGGGLCYIRARVTDEKGRTVYGDERVIRASVRGAGELRAMGSGDPAPREDFGTGSRTTFEGSVMLCVRGTRRGTISVSCSSDGLPDAAVEIACV